MAKFSDRLNEAIEKAEKEATKKERNEAFTMSLYQAIETLSDTTISAKAKNNFLKGFIEKIVYDGDIHIYFL